MRRFRLIFFSFLLLVVVAIYLILLGVSGLWPHLLR